MFTSNALEDITNVTEHPHLEPIPSTQAPHLQILQPYSKSVIESKVDIKVEDIGDVCADNSGKIFSSAYANLVDSPLRYFIFPI